MKKLELGLDFVINYKEKPSFIKISKIYVHIIQLYILFFKLCSALT